MVNYISCAVGLSLYLCEYVHVCVVQAEKHDERKILRFLYAKKNDAHISNWKF